MNCHNSNQYCENKQKEKNETDQNKKDEKNKEARKVTTTRPAGTAQTDENLKL